jgi:hypothetical protein
MAVRKVNESIAKMDPLNARNRVKRELPQDRAKQGNPREAS